jgi:hypothetical protein
MRRGRLPIGGRRVLLADRGTAQRLELNCYPKGSPYDVPYVAGEGFDHLGYSTGHAADVARRLVEHGGKIVPTPTDPLGVRQSFYVEAPDGNRIEPMAWGSARSTPPGSPPKPRPRGETSRPPIWVGHRTHARVEPAGSRPPSVRPSPTQIASDAS